jgi:hypothetical protein
MSMKNQKERGRIEKALNITISDKSWMVMRKALSEKDGGRTTILATEYSLTVKNGQIVTFMRNDAEEMIRAMQLGTEDTTEANGADHD